jgi:hypothetical protein
MMNIDNQGKEGITIYAGFGGGGGEVQFISEMLYSRQSQGEIVKSQNTENDSKLTRAGSG